MDTIFEQYMLKLRETPLKEQTEHTSRYALEALLNHFSKNTETHKITVQHEPKKVPEKGAPDFKIVSPGKILGYVEVKEIGANLDKVLKSDQIKRYRELSDNIILTDYLHFIWLGPDGVRSRETLAWPTDFESRTVKLNPDRVEAVTKLLNGFFSEAPQGIGRSQQLALALATRSRLLRDFLSEELIRQGQENTEGRLHGLFSFFRTQVFQELSTNEFADAYAQMLAYGLFLSRLNAGSVDSITLNNVRNHIPGSFRLIRELVRFIEEMNEPEYKEIRWVVEEILSIVNGLDLVAIASDLSFRQRKAVSRKVKASDEEEHRLFEKDPFIYFYEDFLKAYDAATRKGRGVYYTPPPVVNFIVRAIDDVLKKDFGIAEGLAAHKRVTVLDFACGTGTFLLEIFQRIFEQLGGADAGKADLIVREHILKNLYGFEYLIAPYTIAHLKLSQFLQDRGHALKGDERLQVFLTNTLEPIEKQYNSLLPALSAEVEAAQEVKDKPILVITGNPPYSGHSRNNGVWIKAAIDGYKFTVETDEKGREFNKPLGERNPKWLNDDYVKFIRFAQLKMEAVEEGIVGIITNHSWLDNPTFRGMRQSLMRSFDHIYVLDLHGNAKKKEKTPDGSKDENVFDIEQGVAIAIFVKKKGLAKSIFRGDLWGKRLDKYKATAEGEIGNWAWDKITPTAPDYLFVKEDAVLKQEYNQGWRLPDIMPVNVLGFQTHRDDFAIAFTEAEMRKRLGDLAKLDEAELQQRYGLASNRDWSLAEARASVGDASSVALTKVAYRPFDDRHSFYSEAIFDRPRRELLDHVVGRENVCLGVGRAGLAVPERPWELVTISSKPLDANVFRRGGINAFPLSLYTGGGGDSRKLLSKLSCSH